jgi:hypothetical protein
MNTTELQTVLEAERRRQEKAKATTGVRMDRCKPCFGTGQSRGAKCDTCEGTGHVPAKSMEESLDHLRSAIRVKRVADAQNDAKERATTLQGLIASANVPALHWARATLDGRFDVSLAKWRAKLGTGFLLALVGEWDGGKTQFAVELIRANIFENDHSGLFCTATDFFMDIKATYKPHVPKDERTVINEYCRPSLLVIDEMAKRSESAWENNLLFHLVNKRYNAKLDTVLIANQTAEQFESRESAGPAIVRRLNETGALIDCDMWRKAN